MAGMAEARPGRATADSAAAWPSLRSSVRRSARAGVLLPFVVTYDDRFVGQLTVNNIVRGALRSGQIGYWVDREHAGRGIITTAVALLTDHCFRPENAASRRVVVKLGFREEGYLQRYLDIDGAWRDHISYALTIEDVPTGLLRRVGRPSG